MAKTNKLKAFQNELIASITNEARQFNMKTFKTGDLGKLPNCRTALCMAGHIEALRPKRAKELAAEQKARDYDLYGNDLYFISHAAIADQIWFEETGQPCRLDFFGLTYSHKDLGQLTRKDAVAHIRGNSKNWPLTNADR